MVLTVITTVGVLLMMNVQRKDASRLDAARSDAVRSVEKKGAQL
jgi:low affinity Fe/Cu permease